MKRAISVFVSVVLLLCVTFTSVSANTFLDNVGVAVDFLKKGFFDTTLYLKDTADPDVDEFFISYYRKDGTPAENSIGTYYNTVTGEVIGGNASKGVFDSGFAYNAHTKTFYATNDCWQRQLGFTPLYDLIAKIAFDYTTERIFFDYAGKEWMIQIWKGNYGFDLLVGGEIGIYNRPEGSLGMFYNCAGDEDMMPISIKVYNDERTYVDREAYLTWWATGFVMADPVEPESLTMDFSIEFPNQEICDAFEKALAKTEVSDCERSGNKVFISW